jgi:hypothetical protein
MSAKCISLAHHPLRKCCGDEARSFMPTFAAPFHWSAKNGSRKGARCVNNWSKVSVSVAGVRTYIESIFSSQREVNKYKEHIHGGRTCTRARGESVGGGRDIKVKQQQLALPSLSCLYKTDWHHDKINTIQEQSSYYGGVL